MWTQIDYGKLMHEAMRGLMADVLSRVAEEGLPGGHHFYITFETGHPGVDMAGHLRARYPGEMTIVIQNWFEDLAVMPDRFAITLSFGNRPEPLVIPFDAVKTFVDPSVEFGLRFDPHVPDEEDDDLPQDGVLEELIDAGDTPSGAAEGDAEPAPTGEVVSLDTFRKR